MYKRINWLAMWLIGFCTCGIYALVNWIKLGRQQNEMAQKVGAPVRMHYLAAFLLGFVTLGIMWLVWAYQFGKQQKILAEVKGVDLTPTQSDFWRWVLLLVPGYRYYMICKNHNLLAQAFEEE